MIMSNSSMRGSDYLLQENKMKAFYFRELMPRTYSTAFQPRVKTIHFITKNINPVNRTEFNPGVENYPCNRPLTTYYTVLGRVCLDCKS
jgi:hypothetical protein